MNFQFHIQIQGIKRPPVWRRVIVPSNFNFHRFHFVIQAAFGWTNSHLYQFQKRVMDFDNPIMVDYGYENYTEIFRDSSKIKLSAIFPQFERYIYEYDFGDSWEHIIKLESVEEKTSRYARLLTGKGRCPPEDCGGPDGYDLLKKSLADKTHPEHDSYREWLGMDDEDTFDPKYFPLEEFKELVSKI